MPEFHGFPEGKTHLTPIPSQFFRDLLPYIDQIDELKVTLFVFWHLDRLEGAFRYLRREDIFAEETFLRGMSADAQQAKAAIENGLNLAVLRGTLLRARLSLLDGTEEIYFLNSPKGRAALRAIEAGQWKPGSDQRSPAVSPDEPPNVYRLYEENIGPLTPLIADALAEAEDAYPAAWIEEAIRISVQNNKRSLRYVLTILERWQREGKYGRQEKSKDRPDTEEARRRYVEGEYSDFIEH